MQGWKRGVFVVVLVSVIGVPIAGADDTQLAPVNVIEHYDNGVGTSDAASQGIVSGQLLQDRPLLRPGEVLETVPGLVVTQHSGDGKANQYFLRGYNLDHGTDLATSVDGVPVNMPTNAHGQGYSDLNFLIPELVQHIDYRKGPYFAEDGDFSSAGAVDIHYRNSLDHPFSDMTVGSFGYQRALFAGSMPLAARSSAPEGSALPLAKESPILLGAVETMREDGPWTTPEKLRKLNGLLRLSDGTVAKGWSIDATYYQAHWDSTDQVPLELIQSGQLGRFSALDPSDGGDSGRAILSGEWHNDDARGYSKVSAYMEHYALQLWSNFTFFELRPDTGDQFEQVEQRNLFGGEIARGWNQSLFGHDSVTEVGLQARHDYIHVGLLNTEGRAPFETVSDNLVSETESGLYAQNTTIWTNWFRSIVGLRGDAVFMDMDALVIPQNSGNASANKLSPKLSLIFGPWYKTEFFVNAGKGFHSNDARGVIDKVDPSTCLPPVGACAPSSPVPALAGSTGEEIGMRTEAVSGLQSSLVLWHLNSESELVYAADSSIGSTSPNGASTRYGVEWNNQLIVNRWVLFDADLAWTHARYSNTNDNGDIGNYIPNAVPFVGRGGIFVQHLGPWSGGIETRYLSSYPISQDGSLVAPSAIVTNLRIQRQLAPKAALSLDILNLFNHDYYDIAYEQDYQVSPTSPVVPDGITVHPGEPREFRITLKLQF